MLNSLSAIIDADNLSIAFKNTKWSPLVLEKYAISTTASSKALLNVLCVLI